MTLRAAGEEPPITVSDEPPPACTPYRALPSAAVPDASTPTKLPETSTLALPAKPPVTSIPVPLLPETRLQAPIHGPPGLVPVDPPITESSEPLNKEMPVPLPRSSVPVMSVPMKFPATTVEGAPSRDTAIPTFPEMRLPAPGAAPPIVLPEELVT